jgi:hypothetical protein
MRRFMIGLAYHSAPPDVGAFVESFQQRIRRRSATPRIHTGLPFISIQRATAKAQADFLSVHYQFLVQATKSRQAVVDLVSKSSLLSWLAQQKARDESETESFLKVLEQVSMVADGRGQRRAGKGLWLVDFLNALPPPHAKGEENFLLLFGFGLRLIQWYCLQRALQLRGRGRA